MTVRIIAVKKASARHLNTILRQHSAILGMERYKATEQPMLIIAAQSRKRLSKKTK